MIASVLGEVLAHGPDSVVIRVGGVGLQVFVPAVTREGARRGEHLSLFTHLIVREDNLSLYGFEQEDEREFFRLLLGVNGVGPRLALSIISTMAVDTIRRAVLNEQADLFGRVPGVGKKTAQKIVLYLQGKVGTGAGILEGMPMMLDIDAEVMDALTALGYSVVEAQAALQAIPRDAPADVEERLRMALQYFS